MNFNTINMTLRYVFFMAVTVLFPGDNESDFIISFHIKLWPDIPCIDMIVVNFTV